MQTQLGTCSVATDSNIVTGDADADWTDASNALAGGQPVLFSVQGDDEIPYPVTSFTFYPYVAGPPEVLAYWTLTLSSDYLGATATGALYTIHTDFTLNRDLPLLNPGDTQTAQIISRAFEILDTIGYKGVADGSDAVAGYIGEYIESTIPIASAVALVTNVTKVITSITLTAGDWDVTGTAGFLVAPTTNVLYVQGEVTTATSFSTIWYSADIYNVVLGGSYGLTLPLTAKRFNVTTATVVNLLGLGNFTVAGMNGFGGISARRVR
jgi:hypothetical protein